MSVTPEDYRAFVAYVDGAPSSPNGASAQSEVERAPDAYQFVTLADFAARHYPDAQPLLGERDAIYLARGSLLLVYGRDGSGKSTWTVDAAAHLAAGRDWLGSPCRGACADRERGTGERPLNSAILPE